MGKLTKELDAKFPLPNYCICDKNYESASNFMFLNLHNIFRQLMSGPYLMRSLEENEKWNVEFENLIENDIIPIRSPFKILVLSGTHGHKKKDGSTDSAKSGFTDIGCLACDDPDSKFDLFERELSLLSRASSRE